MTTHNEVHLKFILKNILITEDRCFDRKDLNR